MQMDQLVESRVVSGGMVLKLEAAKRALEGGVRQVHIVGGNLAAATLAPSLFESTATNSFSPLPGTRVLRQMLSAEHVSASSF